MEFIHSLALCANRKMRPSPRVWLNFDMSLLLLLAGDVSLNPDSGVRGLRLGTVIVRSMGDKVLIYLISSSVIVSTYWAPQRPG